MRDNYDKIKIAVTVIPFPAAIKTVPDSDVPCSDLLRVAIRYSCNARHFDTPVSKHANYTILSCHYCDTTVVW